MEQLPDICGPEERGFVANAMDRPSLFRDRGGVDFSNVRSAFAIALHMHQPLIPAGGEALRTASVVSNLHHMMESPNSGDGYNATVFLECYRRMGNFIPALVREGKRPRIMLEYSGTLLFGLEKMGARSTLDALVRISTTPEYQSCVEWLGAPWGHPVTPSTPVQDYRRHVAAWRRHFGALFGPEALGRIRGFSPSEMALPNHPDVAYEFVKTLKDFGYSWVLVQEHTVERPEDCLPPLQKHLPHRLVCRRSTGETATIIAVIKTQGSDTKLIGQMQPYYEASSAGPVTLGGLAVPPLVTQISDGENGGVMMNEFPGKYMEVMRACSGSTVPSLTVTEYLEHLEAMGIGEADFPLIQPLHQKRIWDEMSPGDGPDKLASVIDKLKHKDDRFHMEGGSWTDNMSWVRGYDDVLTAMEKVSAQFHEIIDNGGFDPMEYRYRNALFHLLISQTSCFRYWGRGIWTDYGRELCRRLEEILTHDF